MPKIEFRCNAKPSLFAYPPPTEKKKSQETEKVETAVLSITNKEKQRTHDKEKSKSSGTGASSSKKQIKEEEKMEVDEKPPAKDDKNATPAKKKEPEPKFYNLTNPSRVVRAQLKTLALPESSRYEPLKSLNHGGIILLRDNKPKDLEEIVELSTAGGANNGESSASTQLEAKPHTPFEFVYVKT